MSILIFVGMIMVLGTAAFAWISIATVNNIEGLSLTASSGDELEISLDGINYYSQLPGELIEGLYEGYSLIDVTSLDGNTFYTGGLRDVKPAIPNEHYISFDLWIRSTESERNIFLINHISIDTEYETDEIGTYILSKGVIWINPTRFLNGPDQDDWVEAGQIDRYYASHAMRMSITEMINDQNELDQRTANDLKPTFIFDPSNDPVRSYGQPIGAFSYFFQRTRWWIELPTEKPQVSYRLSETDPNDPYQALDNESWVATLVPTGILNEKDEEYYASKLRVNIWVEGWDADAFDSIDRDQVKIQIQFKALRIATEPESN
jgi:hypothetical protein